LAKFIDLRGADEFPKGVVGKDGASDSVLKQIAGVRTDGGDAGTDVVAFDEGDLANENSGDVGYGVLWAGIVDAEGEAKVASAGPVFVFFVAGRLSKRQNSGQRRHAE
jgi:hypothetical protein